MKIVGNGRESLLLDIEPGTVFMYQSLFYIKSDIEPDNDDEIYCVEVENGCPRYIKSSATVEPYLQASLHLY